MFNCQLWRRSVVAAQVFSVAWVLMAGCSGRLEPAVDVVRPIKSLVLAVGEETRVRTFPGTAEAARRVELAFQVPGVLVELPVKEGREIKQGELIARLRTDEFEARLASLQGQLDQARAELTALRMGERPEERLRRESQVRAAQARVNNARSELDRSERLLGSRAVSQAAHDLTVANYEVAVEDLTAARQMVEKGTIGREEDILAKEAQVRGLEGSVVEASIQLEDCTLRAPYNGVIAQRFVEEGQNVTAKQPIVRFQDVDEIEILVDVPETVMAADIRRADIVSIAAEFSGAPGFRFPVQIREIAQVADPSIQTFNVRVAMQAPTDIRVLPGMTAMVTVEYRRAEILGSRYTLPIAAVTQSGEGKSIVWVIDSENMVHSRPVTVGSVIGGQIEITEGLQAGERIAIAGVSFLREAMQVNDLGDGLGRGQR